MPSLRTFLPGLLIRSYGYHAIQSTSVYSQRKDRNYNSPCYTTNRRFIHSSTSLGNIFESPRPSVDLPVISLSDYMFSRISKFGNKNALVDDATGTVYNYSQLEDLSRKVGSFLYRKGFRKNDVICYYGTNNPEFCLLMLGCVSTGVILTTASPAYTSGELKRHMDHSRATTLVTVPNLVPKAREADISDIIVIGEADGCRPFSDMLADDGECFPTDITINPHEDVAVMPYSSGTTGMPKGVMLSHYNVVSNLLQIEPALSTTIDDTNFAVLPFFHIYGMVVVLFGTLQSGGTLATAPGFDPEGYLKAIIKHKVTQLHVVPPMLLFLTRHPSVDKYDLSRIRSIVCGAAPLGEAITHEFMAKRNIIVKQGYGLTETSPVVSVDYDASTNGSVGPLVGNTEAKARNPYAKKTNTDMQYLPQTLEYCLKLMQFVDPMTGESLGRNVTGELWVRGPQNMKGYLYNEKATKEMIDEDGWLHTGDVGHIKDNDCIVITDRLKELIKYKGMQVAPAELEDLIHKHPAVQDVAVIGMPDDRAGELPRAYVVLKPDISIHAHDVMKYVEQNVADFKRLRGGVEFVKEIPKSPSGKILRRLLKDQLPSSML